MYYLDKGHRVAGCSRSGSTITHPGYLHFTADVSDETAVKEIFRQIKKEWNTLHVLINNAGAAAMNHFLLTPVSTVEKLFNTNFTGTFLFSREAAKMMSKHKKGRIINFSTVAVPLRLKGEAVYAATKAAVVSLTETMAQELGEFGITVNAIGPTPVDTDLIKTVPKNKIDALLQSQAIKRMGDVNDILNVVDFFIDPKSEFITGQVIYLGGVVK